MMRLIFWLFLFIVLSGCGKVSPNLGEKLVQAPPAQKAPQQQTAPPPVVVEKPQAALLKPFFTQFLKRPLEAKVDPFRSNLAHFAPHVEIEEEKTEEQEQKTPLEYYDVSQYKLVLIMSGTAQPKAMVIDPRGKSYVLQVGTKIGTRDGKVVSITSTEVRIEEPGKPPYIMALEPPTVEMEKELQAVEEY
jgi:type IV pilus assembly protein PilP